MVLRQVRWPIKVRKDLLEGMFRNGLKTKEVGEGVYTRWC